MVHNTFDGPSNNSPSVHDDTGSITSIILERSAVGATRKLTNEFRIMLGSTELVTVNVEPVLVTTIVASIVLSADTSFSCVSKVFPIETKIPLR